MTTYEANRSSGGLHYSIVEKKKRFELSKPLKYTIKIFFKTVKIRNNHVHEIAIPSLHTQHH